MRRVLFFSVLALAPAIAFLLPDREVWADQWQVLPPAAAERAQALVRPGSLLVLHCSACRDRVEVVRVESAQPEPWSADEGQRVFRVRGARLLESVEAFGERTYDPHIATFRAPVALSRRCDENVDLAYAYVLQGENRFACLARVLSLPTSDVLSELRLPEGVWRSLVATPVSAPGAAPRARVEGASGLAAKAAWSVIEGAPAVRCDATARPGEALVERTPPGAWVGTPGVERPAAPTRPVVSRTTRPRSQPAKVTSRATAVKSGGVKVPAVRPVPSGSVGATKAASAPAVAKPTPRRGRTASF